MKIFVASIISHTQNSETEGEKIRQDSTICVGVGVCVWVGWFESMGEGVAVCVRVGVSDYITNTHSLQLLTHKVIHFAILFSPRSTVYSSYSPRGGRRSVGMERRRFR